MRIALGVEYDGSPFCGWQSQSEGQTVQDALQRALSQIAGDQIASGQPAAEHISVIAAGRTDTGVHALEQVVHFNTLAERPLTAWVRGVNALLPDSIAVRWAHPVPDEFHARFSAHSRSYRYLFDQSSRAPCYPCGQGGLVSRPAGCHRDADCRAILIGRS